MTGKTEKDIILFDDSNSYSFCYFYSGVFDKKDIETKLLELYTKKLGEEAKFSYKITQENKENTWFASVGCKGKDLVPDKINLPRAYFAALVIAKKYKEEYLYVVVEESSSFMVFLCYKEPIYSVSISNKLLAIASDIGKDITKMTEIFNKGKTEPVKVEKLVFYGSLPLEQINLMGAPAIKEKIKEDKIDYSLYETERDLTLTKEKFEEKNKPEEIKVIFAEGLEAGINTSTGIDNGPTENNENFVGRGSEGSTERNKLISTILATLIFGACAFSVTKLLIKGMNFYRDKINANAAILKTSLAPVLPPALSVEIAARTKFLNASSGLLNYRSDIFKNTVDTTLFGNPKVKIIDFKIEEGVYVLQIAVTSEKDLEDYLSKIIFSNKLILEAAPTEISAGNRYELRVTPFLVF
jgi:hypothetical protein